MSPPTPPDDRDRIQALEQRVRELEGELRTLEQTREALGMSEERFRLAFETSPDAICITRVSDGKMIAVNQGFSQITGWTRAEVLGQTTGDINIWVDAEVRSQMAERIRAEGVVKNLEALFQHKDGHQSWALFSARALMLDGEPHLLSVSRDIDDLRRAEREREELRARLDATERSEFIGRLASGVAHDFNNMLTVIRGFTEILSDSIDDAAHEEELNEIRHATRRAGELTQQLLDFGRRQVVTPRVLDLSALIEQMRKLIRGLVPPSVTIHEALEEGALVRADPAQLERLITNLVLNARDAMPDGGSLTLSTRVEQRSEPLVILEIRDTGLGMDEATLNQIFDPFFTTKSQTGGTGLGLSSVDGIIQQSGGFLEFESAPERGSLFRVCLPRSAAAQSDDEVAVRRLSTNSGWGHLLIVDDDPRVMKLLTRVLQDAGYSVTSASDGEEALAVAKLMLTPPRALLTDIMMPAPDGIALARRLRERWPALPVIFTTGYADAEVLDKLPRDSNTTLLRKVFAPSELLKAVRLLLDAASVGTDD